MNKNAEHYVEYINNMKLLNNRKLLDEFHFMCRSVYQATEEEADKMSILKEIVFSRMS